MASTTPLEHEIAKLRKLLSQIHAAWQRQAGEGQGAMKERIAIKNKIVMALERTHCLVDQHPTRQLHWCRNERPDGAKGGT